ncbi:MAG: transglycosylase SLT domain-containing protein [Bacteroidota bacterium]
MPFQVNGLAFGAGPAPRTRLISLACLMLGMVQIWQWVHSSHTATSQIVQEGSHLLLVDLAAIRVPESAPFVAGVYETADRLGVPADWLMAVIYAESGFRAEVVNRAGSGARGLIQFMPASATEVGLSWAALPDMPAHVQLPFVEAYFAMVAERYGPYENLTDFYLAVLYPRARGQGRDYELYARPSRAYRQNAGLDENRDGRVQVLDIELRLRRMFPRLYGALPIPRSLP